MNLLNKSENWDVSEGSYKEKLNLSSKKELILELEGRGSLHEEGLI